MISKKICKKVKVNKNQKKFFNDNSALSDLIGTILLLGIAIALFSIVYISVLSIPYSPPTPTSNIAFSYNETKLTLTAR